MALQQQLDQRASNAYPNISSIADFVGNGLIPIERFLPMAAKPGAIDLAGNVAQLSTQNALEPAPKSNFGQSLQNILSQYFQPNASDQRAIPNSAWVDYGGD